MTDEQMTILQTVAATGRVGPDTFNGRGYAVAGLVRRGWLEWERGNYPKLNATAILITESGRQAIQQTPGA